MKASEFFKILENRNSDIRQGQAAFNLLYKINEVAASDIVGTENDPFYDDTRMGAFIGYLFERGILE